MNKEEMQEELESMHKAWTRMELEIKSREHEVARLKEVLGFWLKDYCPGVNWAKSDPDKLMRCVRETGRILDLI